MPATRTGKRVAVVGSGPAGMACAQQLARAGHAVTLFEKADRIGGLLRYGIPDFKLDKRVLDRRLTLLVAEGVEIRTSFAVGRDLSWRSLRADHDALLVATGAERPRDLTVPGRELGGVRFAMDFLTRQNRLSAGDEDPDPTLDASGKRVVILGGGDTGSDCLGTALRQGAASARQLELLPRPPEQRSATNQWPQWPLIMRTSSSQEEGGERDFAVLTKELTGEDGQVRKLHAARIEVRGEPGPGMEIVERPGTEFELPADMVLLAMGYTGPESGGIASELGVEIDERSNLKTGAGFETNVEGLFAAGDARRGQSLVVWAISEGREAARSVDAYLSGGESSLPARGRDLPW